MKLQDQIPFRPWVPVWMQVVVAIFILIPTLMVNGAYNGCSIDISNFFGVLSEDINFAFFATSAGMAVAYPVSRKIKIMATPKTILLTSMIMQILLSLVCLHANHIEIIAIASFFIGFLKAFALMEIMMILMPIFGASEKRSKFYSIYYPITLSIGQISMALTAELAYNYKWQYMYHLMIAMLLLTIIVILICLRYARRPVRIPFREIDWIGITLISAFLIALIYVFTYGKVKDWLSSGQIWIGITFMFFTIIPFVRKQLLSKDPYIDMSVLSYRNTSIGYILMFVILFLAQTSSLVSSYASSILKLDSVHSNVLYLWMLPGFIISAILTFWWYKKKYSMRIFILIGFSCIVLSNALLYFQVYIQGTYESLRLPMFVKGFGLLIIYVTFGVYVLEELPVNKRLSNAFFAIGIRSVIVPVVGSSFFSNWLYRLQIRNNMVLSENLDMQNPLAAERFNQAVHSAFSQGMGIYDAQLFATSTIYKSVQIQSILLSIKTILGYCLIASIFVFILLLIFPFYRKTAKESDMESNVRMGKDMV